MKFYAIGTVLFLYNLIYMYIYINVVLYIIIDNVVVMIKLSVNIIAFCIEYSVQYYFFSIKF